MFVSLQPQKEQPYAHTDGSSHPEKGKLTAGLFQKREEHVSMLERLPTQ